VDNSISAALSLLEPALIIFLAVIVGSVVIALFLPILDLINQGFGDGGESLPE
jgi:type IV pilus assembly protein PilC